MFLAIITGLILGASFVGLIVGFLAHHHGEDWGMLIFGISLGIILLFVLLVFLVFIQIGEEIIKTFLSSLFPN